MARLRCKLETSDEYITGEISERRAQAYVHLLYCKAFKTNMARLKKYVGPPAGHVPPHAGIPQFVLDRLPDIPVIPPGMDPPAYGTKTANEARLKLEGPGNRDLIHVEII